MMNSRGLKEIDFRRIGILPNVDKPQMDELVDELTDWLQRRGLSWLFLDEDAKVLGLSEEGVPHSAFAGRIDLAVVLGGDGTMLRAAEVLGRTPVPILGINIGKLGFLTTVEAHEMYEELESVLGGRFKIIERTMLACVIDIGGERRRYRALNEFVVGKLARERMVHLKTYINDDFFMRFSGDGIILATATGSTAYSMSAGGPIVTPELACFILTAVCPHMLFTRPLVLSSKDHVRVLVEEGSEPLEIRVDGREIILIEQSTTIEFFLDDATAHMIKSPAVSFYITLRDKFFYPQMDY